MSGIMGSLQNTAKNIATVGKGIVGQADSKHINNNSKLFLGNLLFTTACAANFYKNSPDDFVAKQSVGQDVIVNGNILLESVNNPTNLFMQSITETTIFAGLVGTLLPMVTEHFKNTPVDMACGVALPFISDGISHVSAKIGTKIASMMSSNKETPTEETKEETPTEEETKEESPEEKQKNLYKTYGAVVFAGILKAGVLGNNMLQGNGHTSNALYAASLFNTLKTGYDTCKSNSKGEKIRDSKVVSGIVLDGVVSPLMTIAVLGLSQKLNLPNTVASTVAKAVVGGVLASGSLKGLTHLLDMGLDYLFNTNHTPKTS